MATSLTYNSQGIYDLNQVIMEVVLGKLGQTGTKMSC